MKRTALCAMCALAAAAAPAGVIEETLRLDAGWNAVYIESTPLESDATAFFAGLPVQRAGCYVSSIYSPTEQISRDGSDIAQKTVSYLAWDSRAPRLSSLKRISGGLCYLVYATNAAEKTFLGTPAPPLVSWQVSSEGFATIAPVSIPAGEEIYPAAYFGEGPAGSLSTEPFAVMGDDPAAPDIVNLNGFLKARVKGGKAYVFECGQAGNWPGVLDVTTDGGGGLDFPDGRPYAHLTVRNAGTKARTVRLSLADSAREGDVAPALSLLVPATATESARWAAFSSTNATLEAGESRVFEFRCDKSGLGAGDVRAAVLAVEDLGGTRMRVRLPVTAAADTYPEGEAAFPAGLWVGTARLAQVSLPDGSLAQAGAALDATILLHVDAQGVPTLLQRVAVAQERGADGSGSRATLYAELEDAPEGSAPRRLSCVFMDTANRAVAASANTDGSDPEFGREATFRFTVGERSKENPFRHPWHPDHDGLRADYSGDAPSGDAAANFIGPVKPEGFSVTNRLSFVWADDNGRPTYSRTQDETTFGRLDWVLTGLRNEPIAMRGIFVLKRVCAASIIR